MSAAFSTSIAYTPISATASSLVIAPPPLCPAGCMLIMTAVTEGNGAASHPEAPSGWTRLSGATAQLGVFYKTAGSSESAYTVDFSAAGIGAAAIAAYPAATIVSSSTTSNSATGVTTYTATTMPSVSSGETVLWAVCNVTTLGDGQQAANLNLPGSPWTTEVYPFGPSMSDAPTWTGGVVNVGLADHQGSTSEPSCSSNESCQFFTVFVVLDITGTAPDVLSVTATASGNAVPGLVMTVTALAGADSPAGIAADGASNAYYSEGSSAAPELPVTPAATGSLVFGAVTSWEPGAAFTARSGTSFSQNIYDTTTNAGYGTFASSGTTTEATALTTGGTAPASTRVNIAVAEILAADGQTLTQTGAAEVTGTAYSDYTGPTVAQTAYFTGLPAAGNLLVATVALNSSYEQGTAPAITISDSTGLTWTALAESDSDSGAYAGVWVAQVSGLNTTTATQTLAPSQAASASKVGGDTTAVQSVTVTQSAVATVQVPVHTVTATQTVAMTQSTAAEVPVPGSGRQVTTTPPPGPAVPGRPFALYLSFTDSSGNPADPSSVQLDITYGTIFGLAPDVAGPFTYSGASAYSSSQVWRVSDGEYAFAWSIPADALPGVYVANWTLVYDGASFTGYENFPVLAGGPGLPVVSGDTGYWTGSIAYTPSAGTPAPPAAISFGETDGNGITWLWQKLEGWDGPDVQGGGVIPMSGDQGAWPSPQYFAARTLTWTVTASAPTQALRDVARQILSSAVPVSDLAVLTVSEPVPKQVQVRRSGKITETYPTLADVSFSIGLVAPDPRKYGTTPLTASVNAYAGTMVGLTAPFTVPFTLAAQTPGGSLQVTNGGNFETRPVITLTGPITSPAVTNVTTGQTVSWSGTVVPAGSQFVIDFTLRQASLEGAYRPADPFSTWWTLPPGTSTLSVAGEADSGAVMSVQWSPAFL